MSSYPIRDPKSDHLLTPQNAALIIIDHQPTQVNSVNSTLRKSMAENKKGWGKNSSELFLPLLKIKINFN